MPSFSPASQSKLQTCHPDLQRLFGEVIKYIDCTIIEGHRGEMAQNAAYVSGNSKVKWPNSKHNSFPSKAVDAAPYPIDWNDKIRFHYFAGVVLGIANQMGIKVRWGGDFDRDHNLADDPWDDLPHFELVD